jgi:DNA-nicking Smr family endonuclease
MSKKDSSNDVSTEDIEIFKSAMQGVRPIKYEDKYITKPKIKSKKKIIRNIKSENTIELYDHSNEKVASQDTIFYADPSIPPNTLRKLRKGLLLQTAILDLHGFTTEEARVAVTRFIEKTVARGCQCIRIIHGKGKFSVNTPPVLKNLVNNWLPQFSEVLAFCSAQPKDGGAGAVYILLRRKF